MTHPALTESPEAFEPESGIVERPRTLLPAYENSSPRDIVVNGFEVRAYVFPHARNVLRFERKRARATGTPPRKRWRDIGSLARSELSDAFITAPVDAASKAKWR